MGKFLEAEKPHQAWFKRASKFFSPPARQNGVYAGKPRTFCLPPDLAGRICSRGSGRRPSSGSARTESNGTTGGTTSPAITSATRRSAA